MFISNMLNKKKKVIIIGAGFSSLSAASYLAQQGFQVEVLEKNDSLGGRARQLRKNGFLFDIGPTWYWMFLNDFLMTLIKSPPIIMC